MYARSALVGVNDPTTVSPSLTGDNKLNVVETAASMVKVTDAVTVPCALVALRVNVVLTDTVPNIDDVGDVVTAIEVDPSEIARLVALDTLNTNEGLSFAIAVFDVAPPLNANWLIVGGCGAPVVVISRIITA
jgi:hypothetical protein